MGLFSALKTGWAAVVTGWQVGVAILRFRRELRKRGESVLSLAAGVHYRRWLENEVLEFIERREDNRIEKLFGVLLDALDLRETAMECGAAVLKSTNLDAVLHGNTVARETARLDIRRGADLTPQAIEQWQGPAADRAQP